MIAIFGTQIGEKSGQDLKYAWQKGNIGCRYDYGRDEYCHEDDRYLILIDTIMDKTRASRVREFSDLLKALATGKELPLNIFNGAYFIMMLDKDSGHLTVWRDPCGLKSGYYRHVGGHVYLGNLVHQVARLGEAVEFDEEAIHQLLYLDYTLDGFTIYKNVHEVRIGQSLVFNEAGAIIAHGQVNLEFAGRDNEFSCGDNLRILREKIVEAHKLNGSQANVVLLSGGIDSAVMAAALDDFLPKERLESLSFRVKGTSEDETVYGRSQAAHLGIRNRIIEIDPQDPSLFQDFRQKILTMNNPYPGVWIFGNLPEASLEKVYFAGQDTRLHTPDLNPIDKLAMDLFMLKRLPVFNQLLWLLHTLLWPLRILKLYHSRSVYIKAAGMVSEIFDPAGYFAMFLFKLKKSAVKRNGFSGKYFDRVRKHFEINPADIRTRRQLYNEIVRRRWAEQYANDIRYMQDLGKLAGTYIAMPFYDPELALYSSTIPYRQATRLMFGRHRFSARLSLVKKYMLRTAFRERLAKEVCSRMKAVSRTFHLLFNGCPGSLIREIIEEDLKEQTSFIRQYTLQDFVERFLSGANWTVKDEEFLLKIHYIAALCLYHKQVLTQSRAAMQVPTAQ